LYIILLAQLSNGQKLAQTAHVVAELQRIARLKDLAKMPVVVLETIDMAQHHIVEHSLRMLDFPPTMVMFDEPDYGFTCRTLAVLVPDDMQFKNQILGKLKLV
jgi:hypothetical protein